RFVAGSNNAPIRARTAERLERAQRRFNRRVERRSLSVGDVSRIQERNALRAPDRFMRDRSLLSRADYDIRTVTGERRARTLTTMLNRRASAAGARADIEKARSSIQRMLEW